MEKSTGSMVLQLIHFSLMEIPIKYKFDNIILPLHILILLSINVKCQCLIHVYCCLSRGLFLGSRISVITSGAWFVGRPRVFPRKSLIRSDLIMLSATSCWPNWARVGLSLQPADLLCRAKCSSSGSWENFSLNMNGAPSLSKSLVSSTNDVTKKNGFKNNRSVFETRVNNHCGGGAFAINLIFFTILKNPTCTVVILIYHCGHMKNIQYTYKLRFIFCHYDFDNFSQRHIFRGQSWRVNGGLLLQKTYRGWNKRKYYQRYYEEPNPLQDRWHITLLHRYDWLYFDLLTCLYFWTFYFTIPQTFSHQHEINNIQTIFTGVAYNIYN